MLLERIPNVNKLYYSKSIFDATPEIITNETLKKWCGFKTFEEFHISKFALSPTIDPKMFYHFVKCTAAPKAKFNFHLNYAFDEQKNELKNAVGDMISSNSDIDKEKLEVLFY
uniref:Uncharacterized protein n=1 Tax=Panagrolaimus sp. ES5 TaxID=591445 RepID=A0AC34G6L7_9BILA